jgi:hypothetical protein
VNLEEYRTLFAATSLALILVATVPVVGLVVSFPGSGESFSELWVLGPNHMAEGYPFNVSFGEEYSVFVGVGNHMGCSEYYMVYVKFRNQTQPLPDVSDSKPSPLLPLYEFRFFVADGEIWESLLTFAFQDVSVQGDIMFVGNVSINGVVFSVDCFSMWDSENDGFYFQLFFELWIYDTMSHGFQYHDRFVGIWLNMTVS